MQEADNILLKWLDQMGRYFGLTRSKVRDLGDLMKTETITTVCLQVFRGIGRLLLPRNDPVALFVAAAEKKWPETCPSTPLQARISAIQVVLGVLKVAFGFM